RIAAAHAEEFRPKANYDKQRQQENCKRGARLRKYEGRDTRMAGKEPAVEHRLAYGCRAGPAAGGRGDQEVAAPGMRVGLRIAKLHVCGLSRQASCRAAPDRSQS